jgi:hypothetical protein
MSASLAFFEGYPLIEQVMDGLAECAGYAHLEEMVRDLQTASGFVHVRDMLKELEVSQAYLILPSAQVSDAAWNKLLDGFWKLLIDERHERHDLTEEQLYSIFESIQKNRLRFIAHLQWLTSDPECRKLALS